MSKLFGNKGEWSEIYVLLRLLAIGKLQIADDKLNQLNNTFIEIINIIRDDEDHLSFEVNKEQNVIFIKKQDIIKVFSKEQFRQIADFLYQKIKTASFSSFSIDEVESFLNSIYINKLKASSKSKVDIKITVYDLVNKCEVIQGFSIKSRLGKASTLINAGQNTNFIYEVTGNIDDKLVDSFNNCSKKIKDRLLFLKKKNCHLKFIGLNDIRFYINLSYINTLLPEICAFMLLEYYSKGIRGCQSALINILKEDPLRLGIKESKMIYVYAFRKLLSLCALGMMPSVLYDNKLEVNGGYIIVKEDGSILCYHLHDINKFEKYLLVNTKFETASTSRHQFGYIYKENNRYFIKLNLQIRFIK